MTSYFTLSDDFQSSYLQRSSYPRNLLGKNIGSYPSDLDIYRHKIDAAAPGLFEPRTNCYEVRFRDLHFDDGRGGSLRKEYVTNLQTLGSHLGTRVVQDPSDPQRRVVAGRYKDPKCRFIYIYGTDSRAPLKTSKEMLLEILTFHQVMPEYFDFMSVFGLQETPVDFAFGSFRAQCVLGSSSRSATSAPSQDALGRSGKYYQLCYNLKCANRVAGDGATPYSIRQAAFYHRFDVQRGNSLWIVTKGGLDIHTKFKELTGDDAKPEDKSFASVEECFRSSLSAHLLFCRWATEDWHGYVKTVETAIDRYTKLAVIGPRDHSTSREYFEAENVRKLQVWHEEVSDIITVLESNVDVMSALMSFYQDIQSDKRVPPGQECGDDIHDFVRELNHIIINKRMQISRTKKLLQRTMERSELVKQHIATQTSERLERLNHNLEKEAILVRIITIVTLIYLPATFVSTFFSTDVIKYQNTKSQGGNFSRLALIRWLQITLPLTFLTLLVAYFLRRWAERRAESRGLLVPKEQRQWAPVMLNKMSTFSSRTSTLLPWAEKHVGHSQYP
ncbi:hypothetical protein F5Y18DRAFT_244679 [Xylariaceae sp. FL1019]|nr:hypothetical protein F5Y18DRAFT_244679 [Xylariaceae sp. FL1019]